MKKKTTEALLRAVVILAGNLFNLMIWTRDKNEPGWTIII